MIARLLSAKTVATVTSRVAASAKIHKPPKLAHETLTEGPLRRPLASDAARILIRQPLTHASFTPARETWMRLSLAVLTILATAFHSAESQACCLTDWLFGRTNAPYAVGYAPNGQAYVVGYAPVTASTYASGYAPAATTPYAAGYAAVPNTTSVLRPAWNTAVNSGNSAYQVQRPTYYDNPSVYTGMPVTGNVQASYGVPVANVLRGTGPASSYLGAGNQYPDNYPSAYASAYPSTASPGFPITTTTPTGSPATALPATPVAPLFVTPPRPRGGLARFFGSLFGTNYRSSYYRAPVTYYRPVTAIDPVSGTTVTVQRPCTSYEQQLQRTPYSSLQVGQPGQNWVQPSSGCQTAPLVGNYNASPYGQAAPYGVAPANGIGQVGGAGSTGQFTIPIPSTAPQTPGGYGGQPGYAPLSGPPSSSASSGNGDQAPVDQPSLQNYPPSENGFRDELKQESIESSNEPPPSYWRLQGAEDSTAMIRPPANRQADNRRAPVSQSPVSQSAGQFTGADPIEAPSEYVSPFRQRRIEAPVIRPTIEAPPLPARTLERSDATSVSNRWSVPVREAALVRVRAVQQPAAPKRDSTWYPIEP